MNKLCERARSERAWKISHFHILKLLFPSIFCWYFWYFISIYFQVSNYIFIHIYNQYSPCYYLWYGVVYKRQYTDKTLTSRRKSMYLRASLEKFRIFTFQNCYIFLSIYFVGTSDTLSVQMTLCLSAYMYRQISKCTDKTLKKHYFGGGGGLSGYANGWQCQGSR